jgi:phenylpropionate dioxygenase-like ring-hydroxylating dioxygenase large terminal subunit
MNRLCAAPSGRADRLRCAYHGWEYDLCGKLLRLPRADRFDDLPAGLAPVRCEVRLGFVWIACSDAAGSIDDHLAPVAPLVAPFHPEQMAVTGAATVEIACNWKLSADVSNEAYHLRALHPDLLQLVDDTRVRLSLHGPHSRYVIPFGAAAPGSPHHGAIGPLLADYLRAHGLRPEALSPAEVRPALAAALRERARERRISLHDLDDDSLIDTTQVHLFPNVQWNLTSTSLELYRHRPHPTDPEVTFFDEIKLERLPPGERPRPSQHRRFRHGDEPLGPIMGQDVDLLPGLQRGLRSSAFPGLLLGADEAAIAHMHARLSRLLYDTDDPTFEPPP